MRARAARSVRGERRSKCDTSEDRKRREERAAREREGERVEKEREARREEREARERRGKRARVESQQTFEPGCGDSWHLRKGENCQPESGRKSKRSK